ncbi:MAG: prepilin-type N-terminal cleavage/methylation domain-containing protein [Patescibacteria group bacterium]
MKNIFFSRQNGGFSLAEIVIVVAILAILGAVIFYWVDPAAKVGTARDKKRQHDVLVISGALSDYVQKHKGALPVLGAVTTNKKVLCSSQSGSNLTCDGTSQLCLVVDDQNFYDKYLSALPVDPEKTDTTDTGYYLQKDSDGNLVVGACTYTDSAISTKPGIRVSCTAYAGGHCWYAGIAGQTCDTVCAAQSLVCSSGATYGPDVYTGNHPFCVLNKALGATCGTNCQAGTSDYPPSYTSDGLSCWTQSSAIACDSIRDAGDINACPCE